MPDINFWLSNNDVDRLFAIKQAEGKHNMTGNEFARELLVNQLYKIHPQKVENEDE